MDDRNHQAFGHGAGLRSFATQMGCRTYFRMARSLSQTGKGFRSDNRQRRCLGIRRPHPNPHPATRKSLRSDAIIMSRTLSYILDPRRINDHVVSWEPIVVVGKIVIDPIAVVVDVGLCELHAGKRYARGRLSQLLTR